MRRKLLILAIALICTLSILGALTTIAPNPQPGPPPAPTPTPSPGTNPVQNPSPVAPPTTVTCTTLNLPQQSQLQSNIGTGIGLSVAALLLSVAVIAIGYMIGKIIPASKLGRWLDQEIFEVTKSAILIAGIYAILSLLGSVAIILNGGTPGTTIAGNIATLANSANTYLCHVQSNVQFSFTFIIALTNNIGLLQGLTIDYALAIPTPWQVVYESLVKFYPFPGSLLFPGLVVFNPLTSLLTDVVAVIALPVIYITTLEQILLPYFVIIGLGILIPIGLIFRAFPFVRGIGGVLIAIGIGIAIVFPATLAILNQSVTNVLGNSLLVQYQQSYSTNDANFNVFLLFIRTVLPNLILAAGFAALQSTVGIYGIINTVLGFNIYLIVQFLLFIVDLAIIFPIVSAIAAALGGTLRLGLGSKMRLV